MGLWAVALLMTGCRSTSRTNRSSYHPTHHTYNSGVTTTGSGDELWIVILLVVIVLVALAVKYSKRE